MSFQLQANDDEANLHPVYLKIVAGTISELAEQLHNELSSNGYSLLLDDVVNAALIETQYYAAWAVFQAQRDAVSGVLLDQALPLIAAEWAILDPVIRAHCDLIQARLMEGSRSLGAESFGLDVSSANQNYLEARKVMQDEAFYEPPFSYTTMSGK